MRYLKADEIECRVKTVTEKGCMLLLYKDARCDMKILDEEFGRLNWQRDHKELKGNIYAGVGVWFEEKKHWVWKWDAGAESNTEAVKGEASDSFKRACVNWGIGRELYTSPFIWIPLKPGEAEKDHRGKWQLNKKTVFRVYHIKSDDDEIKELGICDKSKEQRFKYIRK